MVSIIDKRKNGEITDLVNRQRFIRRFKTQIKKSVQDAIGKSSIKNISENKQVKINKKSIKEPRFGFGKKGIREFVLPGNKTFLKDDTIKKQTERKIFDTEAGNQQETGIDSFIFELTKEEFLNFFFEDMALPNLVEKQLGSENSDQYIKAGFSNVGNPPNIHLIRSFRQAVARKISFKKSYEKKINALKDEKKKEKNEEKKKSIQKSILGLQKKIKKIPFIDRVDIKYLLKIKKEDNIAKAVMICIMDVSGSMDQRKKEIAKSFFILLYLFLEKNYNNVKLVFIRHHTTAIEVNENDFFYSRETGGTVVSSALALAASIIEERFHSDEWNVYVAQASDGDNWNADSEKCYKILKKDILPKVQYYAYVEIMARHHQSLWQTYLALEKDFVNFSMKNVAHMQEIYPVLHDLFRKKS